MGVALAWGLSIKARGRAFRIEVRAQSLANTVHHVMAFNIPVLLWLQ